MLRKGWRAQGCGRGEARKHQVLCGVLGFWVGGWVGVFKCKEAAKEVAKTEADLFQRSTELTYATIRP